MSRLKAALLRADVLRVTRSDRTLLRLLTSRVRPPAPTRGPALDPGRVQRSLEDTNALLEAQNATLRRMLLYRNRRRDDREVVLTASQALATAADAVAVCGVLSDAALRISGASAAWVARDGHPDVWCADGAAPTPVPSPPVGAGMGWYRTEADAMVSPLRAGGTEGFLWLADVPGPVSAGVADDLLSLAGQAGAALARIAARAAEQEAARAREAFLALVSHELRTPLTSVVGYLELVQAGEVGALTAPQARAIGIAHGNARRLSRMVSDLLAVAQARAGGMALVAETDDLTRCVRDAVFSATPAAHARGIALHAPTRDRVSARIDAQRIGQVVDNLLANAIAYCAPGDSVTVDVVGHADRATITVRDTGPGIPPEERARVFESFVRGTGRGARRGVGLGLAISRAIVQAHGGTLELVDESLPGTSLRVDLPRRGAPDGEVRLASPEEIPASP